MSMTCCLTLKNPKQQLKLLTHFTCPNIRYDLEVHHLILDNNNHTYE